VLGLSATSRVSDVVRSSLGFHIIYLIRREETRLEDKRVEILKYLESRRPDAEERQDFIRRLRANARVER
jgi:parvulin-like peptidyl-prolyl isomerase